MFPKTQLPYILSDVANDLTHNGVLDTEKFTREGQKWIEAGLAEDNEIIPIAGIDFVMSTNVPLVANLPSSGKSSYATYVTADEVMFSIALGGFEDVPEVYSLGTINLAVSGNTLALKDNPEATCESRESVETTRETQAVLKYCSNLPNKLVN